jgi:hypothetical protein
MCGTSWGGEDDNGAHPVKAIGNDPEKHQEDSPRGVWSQRKVEMARRRRGIPESHRVVEGLEKPWPSAPGRLAKFYIRIACEGRRFDATFAACYAAWHFLDAAIGDGEFKWISHERIRTTEGVEIYSPELEDIVEYDPTPEEEAWDLPEVYKWQCFYVSTGRKLEKKIKKNIPDVDSDKVFSREDPVASLPPPHKGVGGQRRHAEGVSLSSNGKVSSEVSSSSSSKVSISEICERIGMEPSKARRILRARADLSHMPKGRWAWDDRDVDAIIRILRS